MPLPVTNLYASNAKFKQLWAGTLPSSPNWDRYLDQGRAAGDAMTQARSRTYDEVLLKLSELQEWISEDGTASVKALVGSIIADIEALQEPPQRSAAPAPIPKGPSPKAGGAAVHVRVAATTATVRVDKRTRAVMVDGVIYPSITVAAQTLGRSYSELRNSCV